MPNSWFDFKQFRVEQADASFKVGTDSCLLGAWVDLLGTEHIVDIGTGSGVIALMLAQRSKGLIHAIDRDAQNTALAKENFEASPWKGRLTVEHIPLQSFTPKDELFDHAVCNPPFFQDSTAHRSERTHFSRHDDHLPLNELFQHAARITKPVGRFSMVFTRDRRNECMQKATAAGWELVRTTDVRPTASKEANRFLATWIKVDVKEGSSIRDELILYNEDRSYTAAAQALLSPFYLYL